MYLHPADHRQPAPESREVRGCTTSRVKGQRAPTAHLPSATWWRLASRGCSSWLPGRRRRRPRKPEHRLAATMQKPHRAANGAVCFSPAPWAWLWSGGVERWVQLENCVAGSVRRPPPSLSTARRTTRHGAEPGVVCRAREMDAAAGHFGLGPCARAYDVRRDKAGSRAGCHCQRGQKCSWNGSHDGPS